MAQVTIRGNVGKVRGLQFSNDGKPRFSFSVAEGHGKFDKQTNQWQDTGTTWWNVTVFGREAEAVADVVVEGAKLRVLVQGRSETREYESNGEKRTSLDVIADAVGVLPKPQAQGQQRPADDAWGAPSGGNSQGWGNGADTTPPF